MYIVKSSLKRVLCCAVFALVVVFGCTSCDGSGDVEQNLSESKQESESQEDLNSEDAGNTDVGAGDTTQDMDLSNVDMSKYVNRNIQELLSLDVGFKENDGFYESADATTVIMPEEDGTVTYMEISGDKEAAPLYGKIRLGDDYNAMLKKAEALKDYDKKEIAQELGRALFYNSAGDILMINCDETTRTVSNMYYMFDPDLISEYENVPSDDSEEDTPSPLSYENTIYAYDYIFPDSDWRPLTEEEINEVDNNVKQIGINEIFARHGRKFKTQEIQDFFNSKSWYTGTVEPEDFSETVFNEYEMANIKAITNSMGNVAVDTPISNYNQSLGITAPYYADTSEAPDNLPQSNAEVADGSNPARQVKPENPNKPGATDEYITDRVMEGLNDGADGFMNGLLGLFIDMADGGVDKRNIEMYYGTWYDKSTGNSIRISEGKYGNDYSVDLSSIGYGDNVVGTFTASQNIYMGDVGLGIIMNEDGSICVDNISITGKGNIGGNYVKR